MTHLGSAPLLVGALFLFIVVSFGIRAIGMTLALRRRKEHDVDRVHDMADVALYFTSISPPPAAHPESAWIDLDMDAVYQRLDRTASWPGQHLLYARLRRSDHTIASLEHFEICVNRLIGEHELRRSIRSRLSPLADEGASALRRLFQGMDAIPLRWPAVYPLLSVFGLGSFAAMFWFPQAILAVVAMMLVNAYVRAAVRPPIEFALPAMRMLPTLLKACRALGSLGAPELNSRTETLRRAVPRLQWIGRGATWLAFEPDRHTLGGMLYEYLNLLFLIDVSSYALSATSIRAGQHTIREAYEAIGELDVLQSVATLRLEEARWCRPTFCPNGARRLAFSGLSHPLLSNPVGSTLDIEGRSMLVTGSNMSGKSTFLRSVGVNAILAQSLHTVFADSWEAPVLAVLTLIGRVDSLIEGTSYYRAEVNAVASLLTSTGADSRLILIDELFRGTNSIERVAAAKAVLAHLDREGDLVIVATHDMDLVKLLPQYLPFHFREEVRNGQLSFEYLLHEGTSVSTNAIAILALGGFPDAVVCDARETAAWYRERGGQLE